MANNFLRKRVQMDGRRGDRGCCMSSKADISWTGSKSSRIRRERGFGKRLDIDQLRSKIQVAERFTSYQHSSRISYWGHLSLKAWTGFHRAEKADSAGRKLREPEKEQVQNGREGWRITIRERTGMGVTPMW